MANLEHRKPATSWQVALSFMASSLLLLLCAALFWDSKTTFELWWSDPQLLISSPFGADSPALTLALVCGAALVALWSLWNLISLFIVEAALLAAKHLPTFGQKLTRLPHIWWLSPTSRNLLKRRLSAGAIATAISLGAPQLALAAPTLEDIPLSDLGWGGFTVAERPEPSIDPLPTNEPLAHQTADAPTPSVTDTALNAPAPEAATEQPLEDPTLGGPVGAGSTPTPPLDPAASAPVGAAPFLDLASVFGWGAFTATTAPSSEVVESSYTVTAGDCLWDIARQRLGPISSEAIASYVETIYQANAEVIGHDPNLLFPGQTLYLPSPRS